MNDNPAIAAGRIPQFFQGGFVGFPQLWMRHAAAGFNRRFGGPSAGAKGAATVSFSGDSVPGKNLSAAPGLTRTPAVKRGAPEQGVHRDSAAARGKGRLVPGGRLWRILFRGRRMHTAHGPMRGAGRASSQGRSPAAGRYPGRCSGAPPLVYNARRRARKAAGNAAPATGRSMA